MIRFMCIAGLGLCHSFKHGWPGLERLREDPEHSFLRLSSSGRSTHVSWCDKALVLLIAATFAGCSADVPPQSSKSSSPENSSSSAAVAAADSSSTSSATVEVLKPNAVGEVALENALSDGMNWLTRDELSQGWIRLFDGHTLFGWKSNSALGWSVSEGVITADSRDAKDKGLLVSTTRFANYELRCDYRLEKGGNSGIFLRTAVSPTDPAVDCYELNMCDTHPDFGTASLVKRIKPAKPILGDGGWHSFGVKVDGPKISVKFDGTDVLDYTDSTEKPLTTGSIGLQMNGGKIEFRNIYLKPLEMNSLFDGQSVKGWRVVPGSKSQFEVQDGTIHATNGRGFLETETTSANFVFQFEAITNGDKLNSGIFFRAMKGTEKDPSNGYEFQIHNGFKDQDRTRPDDHGTGAIFKRVSARRVISSDRQWFAGTLIADGLHISTWVDGTQVVDWTDVRTPNENPREGSRVAAGHFSLQGHDPTTDLAFRNLRLAETPQ